MAILPNDVTSIIRNDLRAKLEKDFCGRPFRIFREGDLPACCYFHLRRFLRSDRNWRILTQPLLRGLKTRGRSALPDMLLLRSEKPVFLIELKFRRRTTGAQSKDQQTLKRAVSRRKWAKKAFYIETVVEAHRKTHRSLVPYRNRKISIVMREDRRDEYLKLFKCLRKPKPRTNRPKQ